MSTNFDAKRTAFDVLNGAFMTMREAAPEKTADELLDAILEKITRPQYVSSGVWRDVSYNYRRYARQLPPLYRAEVSPARNSDPDTAQIAALIDKSLRSKHRVAVLFALHDAGEQGATDYELGETCKLLRTSAGKRRKELCDVDLAEPTKDRRPTDTDSPAVVWRITRLGRKTVDQIRSKLH